MTTMVIEKVRRFSKRPLFANEDRHGWSASFTMGDAYISVSKYDDEAEWLADSAFNSSTGMPYFCHGEGDRSCAKQILSSDLAAILDKEIN